MRNFKATPIHSPTIPVATATTLHASSPTLPAALANFDRLPDSAYVRLPTVAGWRNTSTATVWRHVKAGLLPKPVKLGPNITAWRVGDLRRASVQQAGGMTPWPPIRIAPPGRSWLRLRWPLAIILAVHRWLPLALHLLD